MRIGEQNIRFMLKEDISLRVNSLEGSRVGDFNDLSVVLFEKDGLKTHIWCQS